MIRKPFRSHQLESFDTLSCVGACVILLFSHHACFCESLSDKTYRLDDSLKDRICKVDHMNRSLEASSATSCLNSCSIKSCSISIFYNSGNGVCKCCTEPYDTPNGLPSEIGTKYYNIVPDPDEVCDEYLVSGPNGVEDSQLTESAHFCQIDDCVALFGGKSTDSSAIHARLNSRGLLTGAWTSAVSTDVSDYVQVNFNRVNTITAIALQGRDPATGLDGEVKNQYITSFKVRTSLNCDDFTYISNATVAEAIFEGNNSPDQIVVRLLPERILARCVRIHPIQYFGYKSLRFDVLGCTIHC